MERIVKRIAPLLALVVLLTGCKVRMDSNLAINEDESGTYAIEMSIDSEMRQYLEEQGGEPLDLTQEFTDAPEGWSVEEFTNGDFSGVRMSHDFDSIAQLEQELSALGDAGGGSSAGILTGIGLTHEGDEFAFESDLTGVSDALGGLAGADLGSEMEGVDMGAMFEQLFEVRIVITLPGEIGENNADEVSGNTLTWNISLADDGKVLRAASSVGGGSASVVLIAGIVLIGLILLGLGTVYLQGRRRRKEQEAVDAMGDSAAPDAAAAPEAAESAPETAAAPEVSEEPPATEEEPPTP
jgi:hypothetical protein